MGVQNEEKIIFNWVSLTIDNDWRKGHEPYKPVFLLK
jgi:hypothetical protein